MIGISVAAQAAAAVTGTVTLNGAAAASVTVTATNRDTGLTQTVMTGQDGKYYMYLPLGTYSVKAVLAPWQASLDHVIVWGSENVVVNLNLFRESPEDHTLAPPPPASAGEDARPARIVGREFLLSGHYEKEGYGLYSYLLLGTPPTYATRERYIQTLEAYLRFSKAQELGQHVPTTQLNITYVPVYQEPKPLSAELLIDQKYDYARAQALLAKFPNESHGQGPYFVSTLTPLSALTVAYNHYLFQDLSSVPPALISLWVQEFVEQSAQREFWRERKGPQIALKLRTDIARLAEGIDPAKRSLQEWQGILSTLLFWREQPRQPTEGRAAESNLQ